MNERNGATRGKRGSLQRPTDEVEVKASPFLAKATLVKLQVANCGPTKPDLFSVVYNTIPVLKTLESEK